MSRIASLVALFALACSPMPTLEGSWEGELDCGAGARYDLEVDLEVQTDTLFTGEAVAEMQCTDGACDLEFELELELDEEREDGWTLDGDADDCMLVVRDDSGSYTCPRLDDLVLEGDVIEGELEIDGLKCDLVLEP